MTPLLVRLADHLGVDRSELVAHPVVELGSLILGALALVVLLTLAAAPA